VINLADALQECSLFLASLPEDKVYAVMGFTGDLHHRGIHPNYELSVEAIYTSTAGYLYSSSMTGHNIHTASTYPLRLLHSAGIGLPRRIFGLPSWVPDWSLPWPSIVLSRTELSTGHLRQYRAAGSSAVSGGLSVIGGFMILRLEGAVVDRIVCQTAPLQLHIKSSVDGPYPSLLGECMHHNFETTDDGKLVAPNQEDPLARHCWGLWNWHQQAFQLLQEQIKDPYPFVEGQSSMDALWLTLVGDSPCEFSKSSDPPFALSPGTDAHERFLEAGRECLAMFDSETKEAVPSTDLVTRFCPTYIHDGRRLAATNRGFLGLVPAGTIPGDLVCILLGAQTPFVLRPSEGPEGRYEVVGECYMHGMMDGELAPAQGWTECFEIE
jgi:hypothetical protein